MTTVVMNEQPFLLPSLLKNSTMQAKGSLERVTQMAQLLCTTLQKSIEDFQAGNYSKFDALVGENACQIRAVKIQQLSRSASFQTELQQKQLELADLTSRLQTLAQISLSKEEKSGLSLDFLRSRKVSIEASDNLRFLALSYFLAQSKKELSIPGDISSYREVLDLKTLETKLGSCGSKGANLKVHTLAQQVLSDDSVQYLQTLTEQPALRGLAPLVRGQALKTDNKNRSVAPCFVGLKVLLSKLLLEDQALVLRVNPFIGGLEDLEGLSKGDSFELYFKSNEDKTDFELTETPPQGAVLVIEGKQVLAESDLMSKESFKLLLTEQSVLKLLLANAASHTAYPGKFKNEPIPFDLADEPLASKLSLEYQELRQLAESNGFCLNNPSTFLITHILCDQV